MKIEQSGASNAQSNSQPTQPSTRERAISAFMNANTAQPTSASDLVSTAPAPSPEPKSDFEKAVETAKTQEQKLSNEDTSSKSKAATEDKEEPLSSQYAILARKEKVIRQREQQLKAREAAIKAKEAAPAPSEEKSSFDPSKYIDRESLAKDPFRVLTEMGLTYDELTELAMNGPKPQEIELAKEIKALKEELKTIKGETENTKKSFEEQQRQTYDQAVAEIRREVNSLVRNDPTYETIKETNSQDEVVSLIERYYERTNTLLTVEEAAQLVEDEILNEALKIAKIGKVKAKLTPKEAPKTATAPAAAKGSAPTNTIKTLTNNISTSRPLTTRERAILAFEGKLNK